MTRISQDRRTDKPDIQTARLLDDLTALVRRNVIFASEHEARTLALVSLSTYARDAEGKSAFYGFPYVYVRSPGSGWGKTRVFEVMRPLVSDPSPLLIRPTEAVLFRLIDTRNPTLFIDEIHHCVNGKESDGIIAILNGGNTQAGIVQRAGKGTHDLVEYRIGCTKFLAGINIASSLPSETILRSIVIDMPYRPHASDILGLWLDEEYDREAVTYRERSRKWYENCNRQIQENYKEIASLYSPKPEALREVDSRTIGAWRGMLAIALLAGPAWVTHAHEALTYFYGDRSDTETAEATYPFDRWVKVTMERGYVTVSDYAKRGAPPFITSDNYGGMISKDYGHPGHRSFSNISIKSDDLTDITLRLSGDDWPRFWARVAFANRPDELPDAETMLRVLRDSGRLNAAGRGYKMLSRTWKNQKERAQTVIVKIGTWYESGSGSDTETED